ncbi:MAG: PepSY-associated TM helix domain-containing protein [Pseudomonadota bacterium]
MNTERLKRLYDWHSIAGVVLGWFLFTVCLSGTLAVLHPEINLWADPAVRGTTHGELAEPIDVLDNYITAHEAEGELDNFFIWLPKDTQPYYQVSGRIMDADGNAEFQLDRFHAETGAPIAAKEDGLAYWVLNLHRHLMFDRTIGRALVGISGIYMMVLILTGILVHRKILREMFTVRWTRSVHLKWKDAHNALGIWTLPFSTMIAFTGAFLGVVVIVLPVVAFTAFKGDQEAAIEIIIGETSTPSGVEAPMQPALPAIRAMRSEGLNPERLGVHHWGNDNAEYHVYATTEDALVTYAEVQVNAVTGARKTLDLTSDAYPDTVSGRVLAALTPLHYGTYGGLPLKILYYALGLGLSFMVALGMLVWVERRLNGPIGNRSDAYYRTISRLNGGIMTGLGLAYAMAFYASRLADPEQVNLDLIGTVFLGTWIAAAGYALTRKDARRATVVLLGLTGIACVGLPVLDLLEGAPLTAATLTVNGLAFATGATLVTAAWRMRRRSAELPALATQLQQPGG